MNAKYDRAVYRALYESGMSKREIARHLDVDESSVRRGLRNYKRKQRFLVTMEPVAD